VHKVCRKSDNKTYVCKQVPLKHFTPEEKEKVFNEAAVMKQLTCPHIVKYIDAFIQRKELHLVLQYCQCGDLKGFYRGKKVLPERQIWRITIRINLGLEYMHARSIIHRDLKSDNVFLTDAAAENVRIGDLGLAKMISNTADGATTFCGTPRCLAPEVCNGDKASGKSDMWALGVIFFELCTDTHAGPFDGPKTPMAIFKKIVEDQPPFLSLGELYQTTSIQLLDKSPFKRPSAKEFNQQHVSEAEKYGVIEARGAEDGAMMENHARGSRARGSCRDLSEQTMQNSSSASAAFVPRTSTRSVGLPSDGVCSRVKACMGFGENEPALGRRWHRLDYCEICTAQGSNANFSFFERRHHCRNCGRSVCARHSSRQRVLAHLNCSEPLRICDLCGFLPQDGADEAQPIIIAAGEKAYFLDVSTSSSQRSVGKHLRWVGLASYGSKGPEVLCMLDSSSSGVGSDSSGSSVEVASLDTADYFAKVPLPKQSSRKSGTRETSKAPELIACSGPWLATSTALSAECVIQVIDVQTHGSLGQCRAPGTVTALAVNNGDYGFIATGADDGAVRIYNVPRADEMCSLLSVLKGHAQQVTCIVLGCDASIMCTGSKDNTIRLWRQQKKGEKFEANHPDICEDYNDSGPSSMCCDGSFLAFRRAPLPRSTWGHGASLWNLVLGRWERSFYKRDLSVRCLALRGALLVTSSGKGTHRGCSVQLWHAPTGTALAVIQNPEPIDYLLISDHWHVEASRRGSRDSADRKPRCLSSILENHS
jgi:serine/threonine protein kinase